jgi:hypothetical protein
MGKRRCPARARRAISLEKLPSNYPAQDYGRLFDHTSAAGVGVIGMPRACRRCAVRIGRASSDCKSAARADRLSYELRCRCRAGLPLDAAGKGGVCREPDRIRHAVRDLASGHGHNSGRHGDATTVRGRAFCGPKGPAAACVWRAERGDIGWNPRLTHKKRLAATGSSALWQSARRPRSHLDPIHRGSDAVRLRFSTACRRRGLQKVRLPSGD